MESIRVISKGLERLKNKNLPCSNCKELKALEIIKNKGFDIGWFQRMWKEGMTYDEYNFSNSSGKYYLTQEEYDLLREVLL